MTLVSRRKEKNLFQYHFVHHKFYIH